MLTALQGLWLVRSSVVRPAYTDRLIGIYYLMFTTFPGKPPDILWRIVADIHSHRPIHWHLPLQHWGQRPSIHWLGFRLRVGYRGWC